MKPPWPKVCLDEALPRVERFNARDELGVVVSFTKPKRFEPKSIL